MEFNLQSQPDAKEANHNEEARKRATRGKGTGVRGQGFALTTDYWIQGSGASRRYNTEKTEKPPLRAVTLANDLQLKWLGFESQQVKVGRGERVEAYGEGRRARRGSRYARQGAVLC